MKYDIESINKRKERERIARTVIEIIAIILVYNIILIAISSTDKISLFNILNYKSYVITTDSMEPKIKINDVVITKKVKKDEIKVGDVITFLQDGEVITHRITQIESDEEETRYTTKGDNNNMEDIFKITYENIEGKHVLTIPYLGKIIEILENRIVFLIIILIVLIYMFVKVQNQEKKENRREKKKIEDKKRKNIAK